MIAHSEYPSTALVAYSELLDRLLLKAYSGKGLSLFTRTVKGKRYWYLQFVVGDKKRSCYLGPDTPNRRRQVEQTKRMWASASVEGRETRRLVAMLAAAGLAALSARESRVMVSLAQSGVFLVGGVLVGSHAFQAIGNLLGVSWGDAAGKTHDIDIADD